MNPGVSQPELPFADPAADAVSGAFPSTEQILIAGGDDRIALSLHGTANRYGCTPRPDPGLLALGSATASTISAEAFAAADALRLRLADSADDLPAVYGREMQRVRESLLSLCALSDLPGVEVVFGASGTDLHLFAAQLSSDGGSRPLLALTVQPEETGSCVPSALGGRHFSTRAALGGSVTAGAPLMGGGIAAVAGVPVRDAYGHPREAASVDREVSALVEGGVAAGSRVLLTLTDTTKTGLTAPTPACALALKRRWPEQVDVLVDACQFRLAPTTLRAYLQHGFMVAITGSKFLGGPTFAGALLVPQPLAERFAAWRPPLGITAYSVRADWPQGWKAAEVFPAVSNPGLLLRWEAALEELRRFRAVPEVTVEGFVNGFGGAVAERLAGASHLAPLAGGPGTRSGLGLPKGWDGLPTVFAFVPHRIVANGHRVPLGPDEAKSLYRSMRVALTRPPNRGGNEQFAGLRAELGQPVVLGEADGVPVTALRLCLGARLIVEAASSPWSAERVIANALLALDKAEWLASRVAVKGA